MKKSFVLEIYLIISTFVILMPISFIILVQQKVIPSFEKWEINNFICFILFMISLIIILANKIIKVSLKIKEIKNNLNIRDIKYCKDVKLASIDSLFNEIDKINRGIKVLKFENSILYDTALVIHNAVSIQELLDTILARLVTHTNADFGLIFLSEEDELKLKSHSNVLNEDIEKTAFRIGEGLVGWTFYKGDGMLTYDVQKDYRYIRCINGTRAQITMPIKMHDRILGVLVLGSKETSEFGVSDFKLINTISGEIGLAINNAILTENLQKENQNNQMLFELTKKLTSSVELNEVAKIAVKTVVDVIEVQACVLAVFDEEKEDILKVIASYGSDEKELQHLKIKGTIERAFIEKLFTESKTDEAYVYSIPLISKENCIGILHINLEQKLTTEEIEFINSTTAPLTSALENAFLYKNVETLAIRDGLTGIYNHRYFQNMLDEHVNKAQRYGKDLSMVMLDIDNFKKYNDTYGHPVGDLLLKKVVDVMQNILRDEDIIFRYGGDEFTIIMPDTNIEEAKISMERIRDTIAEYKFEIEDHEEIEEKALEMEVKMESTFKTENLFKKRLKNWFTEKVGLNQPKSNSFNVTISVGISSLIDVAYDKEMLIKNADNASLKSKRNGKNQVSIWRPELNDM